MRMTLRKLGSILLLIYLLFTCYSFYSLIASRWRRFISKSHAYLKNASAIHYEEKLKSLNKQAVPQEHTGLTDDGITRKVTQSLKTGTIVVEIWGKAAIGLFLWEHVLRGTLEERLGGIWSYGVKKIGRLKFRFRTGAGLTPEKAPRDIENLVLIINGREPAKMDYALMWLDLVAKYPLTLRHVGVVLLGREDCDNDWLTPHLTSNGGRVDFAFVVYDWLAVDDDIIYQWPLGVATYRNFPRQCLHEDTAAAADSSNAQPAVSGRESRLYSCNFLGTVYRNSSREQLVQIMRNAPTSVQRACMMKVRTDWVAQETEETLAQYITALSQSDLTLNPSGKNPECYRHFEAVSCGSVPVVLNNTHEGNKNDDISSNKCDVNSLRLFKKHKAPFIWLGDWNEAPGAIEAEYRLSQEEKVMRRQEVIRWYQDFLRAMRQKFISVILKKFSVI